MRLHITIERVTSVTDTVPEKSSMHVKVVTERVIMRTRTTLLERGALEFRDSSTGQLNERFVINVRSKTHLMTMRIRLQLRKSRWFLRSAHIGDAQIGCDIIDVNYAARGTFPIHRSADAKVRATELPVGFVTVRMEIDGDVDTKEKELVPALPHRHDEAWGDGGLQDPLVPSPSRWVTKLPVQVQRRAAGTQTDRLTFTAEDSYGISSGMELHAPSQPQQRDAGAAHIHSASQEEYRPVVVAQQQRNAEAAAGRYVDPIFSIIEPPASGVNWGATSSSPKLPVGAHVLRNTSIAYPTDAWEGLLLYCDKSAQYQRELEDRIAKCHVKRIRTRVAALGSSSKAFNDASDDDGEAMVAVKKEPNPTVEPNETVSKRSSHHSPKFATIMSPPTMSTSHRDALRAL